MNLLLLIFLGLFVLIFLSGIRIIRPTHRGVLETLGKYTRYINPGFTWIIPLIQQLHRVNITEQIADVDPLDMITQDNLNASVDMQVYYKVIPTEKDVQKAFYNVNDVEIQIISLAQTTARNVIGDMKFKDVNSKRDDLNTKIATILKKQIVSWGIEIVRVELKEISPPKDVQETMNKVIKAQNEKDAAIDFATAKETEADGLRRAAIKQAEGEKKAKVTIAEGEAEAIKLVNQSAEKYFKGNAKELKMLEALQNSLQNNSKIILGDDGKSLLKLLDVGKETSRKRS